MVRKTFVINLISALCAIFLIIPATAEVVHIPDVNLRAAINKTLNKPITAAINEAELLHLTELSAVETEISDLTGLEHATNLTELNLFDNIFSDVSPLANLTNLTKLFMYQYTYPHNRGKRNRSPFWAQIVCVALAGHHRCQF